MFTDELKEIVGVNGIQGPDTVAGLDPGWHQENLAAGLIVLPVSADQVSRVVVYCNREGISLVPHGGRTSPCHMMAKVPGKGRGAGATRPDAAPPDESLRSVCTWCVGQAAARRALGGGLTVQ